MEEDVAAAVVRMMAEVLRPVGAVGDLRLGAEDGADIGGECRERRDERICGSGVARLREAAKLRAENESVAPEAQTAG